MKHRGFTVVEILVVIGAVAMVTVIITEVFFRTLRGANKAQILSAIKKNGQSVLELMDKTIRAADNVVCSTADTIVIESSPVTATQSATPLYSRFKFVAPIGTFSGKIDRDSPVTYSATLCSDPISSPLTITDTNPQTGVSVVTGSFNRNQLAGFKDVVTIQFSVAPGVGSPKAISGQIDPVTFTTTVGLR